MARQTHYDILQVSRTAEPDAIKRAYRERIRRFHPDQFAAERSRLQQAGDQAGVRALDRKIERSKQMTQQINAAYDVLMDPLRRKAYDRQIAEQTNQRVNAEIQKQRAQHPEYVRRTVKSRPHNNPNRPKQSLEETVPRAAIAGFIIVMIVIFGWLSSALGRVTLGGTAPQVTAIGFTAQQLQATQNAINATQVARDLRESRESLEDYASPTPRPTGDTLRAANAFYEAGRYTYAIELYNSLLADTPTAEVYTWRGMAYTALYQGGDEPALQQALDDYAEAIRLDGSWAQAYRERGLLYYARWLQTDEQSLAQNALDDLEQYATLTQDQSAAVTQAIDNLRAAIGSPF